MKTILSVLIFFSAYSDFFIRTFNLPILAYCDEILLIFSIGYILNKRVILKKGDGLLNTLLIGIFVFSIISFALGQKTNYSLIIPQVIIHFKLFLITYLITQIFDKRLVLKVLKMLFGFLFLGMIVNVLLGENFNEIYDIKVDYRFGIFSVNGFQMNRNALGLSIILLFIILNNFVKLNKNLLFSLAFLAIFITGSRTGILLMSACYFYLNIYSKYKKMRGLIFFFLIVIIIPGLFYSLENSEFFLITKNNFSQINNESGYIRGIILYFGFILAAQFFPFGSGAATFATTMSKDSEVYSMIGLENSVFIQEFHGIFDSNFASILGELGYLGVLFFIILFVKLKSYLNVKKNDQKYIMTIILLICIYSLTTPVFMSSNFVIFPALAFAYFYNSNKKTELI